MNCLVDSVQYNSLQASTRASCTISSPGRAVTPASTRGPSQIWELYSSGGKFTGYSGM
jgi:hypothetical protein